VKRKDKTIDAPETAPAAEAPREKVTRAAAPPSEAAPKERQPDFVWSGQPVYRCRLCGDQYERVSNLAAVLDHEATQHPTNARVSQVLGPGGKPLIVVD
jgi:hypothetical protein